MKLGWYLRAKRLGYHQVPGRPYFMRMTPEHRGRWGVELHPIALIPSEKGNRKQEQHIVWWERQDGVKDEGEELFALWPMLRSIKAIKQPMAFYINEHGEVAS